MQNTYHYIANHIIPHFTSKPLLDMAFDYNFKNSTYFHAQPYVLLAFDYNFKNSTYIQEKPKNTPL
jgi:hypothetical protein